jgi:hypothetical protein
MIVICAKCRSPLYEPGALVFSPPWHGATSEGLTQKFHLCRACWAKMIDWFDRCPECGGDKKHTVDGGPGLGRMDVRTKDCPV